MNTISLPDFIEEVGSDKAAELFGIARVTADKYRNGERRPRPDMAHKIIQATHGRVTWEGIYPPPSDAGRAA